MLRATCWAVLFLGVAGSRRLSVTRHVASAAVSGAEVSGMDGGVAVRVAADRSDTNEFIDTAEGVQAAAARLVSSAGPIAVDTEGVNIGRNGRMTLIQFAVPGFAAVFDVQAIGGDLLFCEGCDLGDLLRDRERVKLFFDCRRDVDVLDKHFGLRAEGIVDLQIADVILRGDDRRTQLGRLRGPLHWGSISKDPQNYFNIVKLRGMGEVLLEYGLPDKSKLTNAQHELWGERPLSEEMKEYAFGDPIGIRDLFEEMQKRPGYREVAEEIREASDKFADQIRMLETLPDERYTEHALLPLCVLKNFPPVNCDLLAEECSKCWRNLPRSVLTESRPPSGNRSMTCDVCRAIDTQIGVRSRWRRQRS